MSYHFTIEPREITISPGALVELRYQYDLKRGIPQEIIQVLDREFSIDASVVGYDSESGEPEFLFELQGFSSPERLGLQGVVEQLTKNLKYAENQSFELTDERGAYLRHMHIGRYNREDY